MPFIQLHKQKFSGGLSNQSAEPGDVVIVNLDLVLTIAAEHLPMGMDYHRGSVIMFNDGAATTLYVHESIEDITDMLTPPEDIAAAAEAEDGKRKPLSMEERMRIEGDGSKYGETHGI